MKRKHYVDFAKFLAILIVLLNHTECDIPFVNAIGGMFYVPLFFVCAGYTYHIKDGTYWQFTKKKVKRLLVPYFTANVFLFLFFLLKDFMAGHIGMESLRPFLGIFYSRFSLYPLNGQNNIYFMTILNSPTWFLTALFLTYLLFEVMVRVSKGNHRKMGACAIVSLIIGIVFRYFVPLLLPWSLDTVFLFVLYMFMGFMAAEKDWIERGARHIYVWGSVILLSVFLYVINGSVNISVGYFGKYVTFGLMSGIISSLMVLMLSCKLERFLPLILCKIGQKTLPILCYHLFVLEIFRTLLVMISPQLYEGKIGNVVKTLVVILTITFIYLGSNQIDAWKRKIQKRGSVS